MQVLCLQVHKALHSFHIKVCTSNLYAKIVYMCKLRSYVKTSLNNVLII